MKKDEFEKYLIKLGERIKELRLQKGLRQEDMDDGPYAVSVSGYQNAEYGIKDLQLSTLYKISKRLGVNMGDLFDF